ncbi:hypothetical protein RM788_19700 [Umezawaea sp. Da 62-37]|nr:hypothetical protein [Umezawaea sp. Da 62-37]WNV90422.1 hypothetical protein RM788_19700 [Umezawaea sp. Da 62-37]
MGWNSYYGLGAPTETQVKGVADHLASSGLRDAGYRIVWLDVDWQVLRRAGFYRGGPVLSSAAAGYDQALWDIAGEVRGVPVHELLGGPVRDRVRVHSW